MVNNVGILRLRAKPSKTGKTLTIEQQKHKGRVFVGETINGENMREMIDKAIKVMEDHRTAQGKQLTLFNAEESK